MTMKTWHAFSFLIITAVLLYYAKMPILVIAAIVIAINVWLWLCRRYPRTMLFVFWFLRGLLGGRRR
jgi:hypothetical protein